MSRGRFAHNMDSKGRLAIPQALRMELQAHDKPPILTSCIDAPAVGIYTHERWVEIEQRLANMSQVQPEVQKIRHGMGIEDVLCQNDDLIGVAYSWMEPSGGSLRDQYVFETFYRINITPHTHLTPDVQVVIDPANAPNKSAVTVFGLRIRTLY